MSERQNLLQSMIESALRAAADPAVTEVRRSWDWFDPGSSVQPIMPILVVSVTNDRPILVGYDLCIASCTVAIVVDWSPGVRDQMERIRASVRSVMASLRGLAAAGLHIDGVREDSCLEPSIVEPDGDTVLEQDLSYTIWSEAPPAPHVVVDPEIFLAAYDPATGVTYTTTQAADPRRITRWSPSPSGTVVFYACGAWADRASLQYTAPVTPISGANPPPVTTSTST